VQSPASYTGFATNMANSFDNPARNHYYHAPERIEEHKVDLVDQAKNPLIPREPNGEKVVSMLRVAEREEPRKRRGVVYERRRAGGEQEQELPERLMTPQQITDILQLPPSTVWSWLSQKRLREWGRLWLAEPGGRSRPLVSLSEAESLKEKRRVGRPRKNQT
jgi:hypothetical protein